MADDVLNQSMIDALLEKNTEEEEPDISGEMQALLSQGRKCEKPSVLSPNAAARTADKAGTSGTAVEDREADEGEVSGRSSQVTGGGSAGGGEEPNNGKVTGSGGMQVSSVDVLATIEGIVAPLRTLVQNLSERINKIESKNDSVADQIQHADSRIEATANRIKILGTKVGQLEAGSFDSDEQSATLKVETAMSRIAGLETELAQAKASVEPLRQSVQSSSWQIEKINRRIGDISTGLSNTFGYNLRNSFECTSCGSFGFVAGPVQCTQCGEEGLWGWFPPEVDEEQACDDDEYDDY